MSRNGSRVSGIPASRARAMCAAIGLRHSTELELEVIAHMRGALVNLAPLNGSRANLIRVGARAVISVAETLSPSERRWAIAHELGHFEIHANANYIGLCTGEDLGSDYRNSGREEEANAFAAELLMPESVFRKRCDAIAKVNWTPIQSMADEFQVSLTAAAIRFVNITAERVAVFVSQDSKVKWSVATSDFGGRLDRGSGLSELSLAVDYFQKGKVSSFGETVSAEAWVPDASQDQEIFEHSLAMPSYNSVITLIWYPEG
jgi:Zn-dependent peptidase ImmA (M78 family)